ncbi:hypothetical protein [Streptomyces sp. 900105245]
MATYLRMQTGAVRQALAAAERRTPDLRQLPPQPRPSLQPPAREAGGFVVEKLLHVGHPLGATVHRAGCTGVQRDINPISAGDAR